MACGSKGFSKPAGGAIRPQDGIHRAQNAVDIEAADGSPVTSPVGGQVIFAFSGLPDLPSNQYINAPAPIGRGRWGNDVVVAGDDGCVYLMAHMAEVTVSTGDRVQLGELVGTVGQSGHATGPHVHFQVAGDANVISLLAGTPAYSPAEQAGGLIGVISSKGLTASGVSAVMPLQGQVFGFPLASYLKVAAGGVVIILAMVVVLAAMGLRSGKVEAAVSRAPIVGPTVRRVRARGASRTSARKHTEKVSRAAEIGEVRAKAGEEKSYRQARARRRASEGLSRSGEEFEF